MIDLEKHRMRHRLNGFPIYGNWIDGEENDIVGYISEPLWQWADLSDTDKATVQAEADGYRADPRGADWTEDEAFWYACGEWAIACPHLHWTYHEPIYRECKACRTMEPLPGRVVYVGDKPMRFTSPPPPRLRIPRPSDIVWKPDEEISPMELEPECDVYEWHGNGYHLVSGRAVGEGETP